MPLCRSRWTRATRSHRVCRPGIKLLLDLIQQTEKDSTSFSRFAEGGGMTRVLRVTACLALGLAFASILFAQSEAISGVIEGTIYDPNGAPMGGVAVTLKNTGTNYEQTLTTNKEGRFRALRLPPGPYVVTATVQGFATLVREGIDLVVGQ